MKRASFITSLVLACGLSAVLGADSARAEGGADASVALLEAGPMAGAWAEALRVELAAGQVAIVLAPPPSEATSLMRASEAQRAARAVGATHAVWVERTPTGDWVRAIDAESEVVRDAPLPQPAQAIAPRTFAAVAASLLDEIVAAPTAASTAVLTAASGATSPEVRVTVHVETPTGNVDLDAVSNAGHAEGADALRPPPMQASTSPSVAPVVRTSPAPGVAVSIGDTTTATATATEDDGGLMPRSGFVLELGAYTAAIAFGGRAALGYYLNEELRLTAFGMLGVEILNGAQTGLLGLELTHIGQGRDGRFDFGAFSSMLMIAGDNTSCTDPCTSTGTNSHLGIVVGAHIGWMWELSSSFGLGFKISGGGAFVAPSFDVTPFGLVTLVSEIGL